MGLLEDIGEGAEELVQQVVAGVGGLQPGCLRPGHALPAYLARVLLEHHRAGTEIPENGA